MSNDKQMAQPVLVTGATGFIGSRVVHKLLEQNMAVKALVLPNEALPAAWGDRVEVVRGGISQPEAVAKAVAGARPSRCGASKNAWSSMPARRGSKCHVTSCGTPWLLNSSMPTPPW